jgi:hypothetical protein
VSTPPLTLPTVEELRAAFPQATNHGTNVWGNCVGLTIGATDFRLTGYGGQYVCKYADGKGRECTHPSDWQQAILSAVKYARARYARKAEEAQAAVAALDKAMEETPCPSSK